MASPSELTPKEEDFARVYVETSNASEAYRQVYNVRETTKPESVWQCASRILAKSKVAARVMELQDEARERLMVTMDSLTLELEEARTEGKKNGQAAAMVSATLGKAKLHGHLVDKVQQDQSITVNVVDQFADNDPE